MAWTYAAELADFAEGDVIGREIAGREVALYRLGDEVLATAGLCTHGAARLAEGEVVEGYVECPLHHGLFEIATGKAQGGPVSRDLRTYPVRIEDGRIEIEIGDA